MGIILDLLSVRELFSEAYNALLDFLAEVVIPGDVFDDWELDLEDENV